MAACLALTLPASTGAERAAAAGAELSFEASTLELPGEPETVLSADLDRDGLADLAVISVGTRWDEIGIEEPIAPDLLEALEAELGADEAAALAEAGGLESMTIVPALFARRTLSVFLATAPGRWGPLTASLELADETHALVAGPPAAPLLLFDDRGLAAVRLDRRSVSGAVADGSSRDHAAGCEAADTRAVPDGRVEPGSGLCLDLEPLTTEPSVLAGTRSFVDSLDLSHDLEDDGRLELLFPGVDGLVVYRQAETLDLPTIGPPSPALVVADRVGLPTDRRDTTGSGSTRAGTTGASAAGDIAGLGGARRLYPLPTVRDIDGDGLADLLIRDPDLDWQSFYVARGAGEGRFLPFVGPLEQRCLEETTSCPPIVFFGDLDGDGAPEYLSEESLEEEDVGFRRGLQQAKRPEFRYRRLGAEAGLAPGTTPLDAFQTEGYAFDTDGGNFFVPSGLRDLDGDGDLDLVTLTLDVSAMQLLRVVTLRSLSIGFDFHIYCQDGGTFERVTGLDLSGRFKVRLSDIRIRQISQLRGDFDGDGRADFLQAGRGRDVTIHRGRPGCRYPAKADATIRLDSEPEALDRVRIGDFDGDGRSDLLFVEDLAPAGPPGQKANGTRLLVYRSAGSRL